MCEKWKLTNMINEFVAVTLKLTILRDSDIIQFLLYNFIKYNFLFNKGMITILSFVCKFVREREREREREKREALLKLRSPQNSQQSYNYIQFAHCLTHGPLKTKASSVFLMNSLSINPIYS